MKARVLALYLPQFHPIPENDQWWGKGFTEWTNVGKAKSLFPGHYQPRVPTELGYYDLRVAEARKAQADIAREHGVEGFIYWHYWFGEGKRLLERPFNEVLESGEPDFPFALAWANESWKGLDHGLKDRKVLIEQKYPSVEDYTAHFYAVLPAFKDKRYITVDGKPLFMIYLPLANPEVKVFIETWRELAVENGLEGIYFMGHKNSPDQDVDIQKYWDLGVDAVNTLRLYKYFLYNRTFADKCRERYRRFRKWPRSRPYDELLKDVFKRDVDTLENVFPSIIPNWDHTPRTGVEGVVVTGSTPDLFEQHVKEAVDLVKHKEEQHRILVIKSWNEWAEGNYMEPDLKWGRGYLEALKRQIE